jgi:hypothetical protein
VPLPALWDTLALGGTPFRCVTIAGPPRCMTNPVGPLRDFDTEGIVHLIVD